MNGLVFLVSIMALCAIYLGIKNIELINNIEKELSLIPKECPRPIISASKYAQIQNERRMYENIIGGTKQ